MLSVMSLLQLPKVEEVWGAQYHHRWGETLVGIANDVEHERLVPAKRGT